MHSLIASRLLEYSSTDQQCLNFVELYMKVKMFMQCLSPPNVFCGVCVPGIERLIDQIRRLGLPPAPPQQAPCNFSLQKATNCNCSWWTDWDFKTNQGFNWASNWQTSNLRLKHFYLNLQKLLFLAHFCHLGRNLVKRSVICWTFGIFFLNNDNH